MDSYLKVLFVECSSGYYKIKRYRIGDFFGPVDLGLHLATRYNTLNIGTGLLAGSIFPGSNRLIFSGFSPCWGGFYISSMGGAGLIFDDLGINLLAIKDKADRPSVLYLNRVHGEEIEVEIYPADIKQIWKEGRTGVYSLMDHMNSVYGDRYEKDPRILAAGPASSATDFGAVCSVPLVKGKSNHVDTWAGRGGFGSKMLQQHGIAGIIYGGTYIDEDFRDRKVADAWFVDKYQKKLAAKDLEATTKYRYDPKFNSGGTFGVNYSTLSGRMLSFNYSSIFMSEEERLDIDLNLVQNHYLKQFNEETIEKKQQKTCGEPCVAVCKKMNDKFKKDYEPYQVMGPLSGIFDQRAAEKVNHLADAMGFDAIAIGGIIAWLMELLDRGYIKPDDVGVSGKPKFNSENFDVVEDSGKNASIAMEIIHAVIEKRGILNLDEGARKLARRLSREVGQDVMNSFVFTAFGRNGWMVPNQYWTPGVLSPMPIMGKYYMNYGNDFIPPRELGRKNAERMVGELILDNFGLCRFHRQWAEEMIPEIVESLYGLKDKYLEKIKATASRINSRNASVFWESERCMDYIHQFLKRKKEVDKDSSAELDDWLNRFEEDKEEAALSFWYEIHKGIHESLREF